MSIKVIILAAGKGTRMKSQTPKVLHEILNKKLIDFPIDLSNQITDSKPVVVVGHKSEQVVNHISERAIISEQKEQKGTGHAVKCALDNIEKSDDVVILCGDTPLITASSLKKMLNIYKNCDAVIMGSIADNPSGYGRIALDSDGNFEKIIEHKDCTDEELKIDRINAGIYIIKGKYLIDYIDSSSTDNSQNEYYLPDVFSIMRKKGLRVEVLYCPFEETLGVNTRLQLEDARKILQQRILNKHMENGVTIVSPETVHIDSDTFIDADTTILPNTFIKKSAIGSGCIIGPNTTIENAKISQNVSVKYSYIEECEISDGASVGPYSHIRPNSKIDKNSKIGNFVEVKNSTVGENSKAAHLAYIGDAKIGKNVNIGCGVIFVNYDGVKKYQSIVKDGAFIGSNSNLVAPIIVEEQAYIACGSTITKNVKKNSLCIERSEQREIEDWVLKRKIFNK